MKKIILAATISASMLFSTGFAAPVAEQNRETGNIEIKGIEQPSVTVQVLRPEYKDGSDVSSADIVNIMFFEDHNGEVVIPVDIKTSGTYIVKVNGRDDNLWQTELQCYNTEELSAVMNILVSGTADEIYEFLEEKENREALGIDEETYNAMTSDGRKLWSEAIADAEISEMGDYTEFYNANFGYFGISYAGSAKESAAALEKYEESILDSKLLGYDDYDAFDDAEKADACEIIINNPETDKEKFEKIFSEAVFLASLANIGSGADVNPLMEKYEKLFSSSVDEYFSMKDTYSVDSKISGKSFDSIDALEDKIEDILDGASGGSSRPSGGGSSGGGYSGGSSKHIEAVVEDVPEAKEVFNDLDGVKWAEEAILGLNKMGIANGDGNGSFRPLDNITREEFVKLLTLAFDKADGNGDVPFADVKADEWYYPYVMSGYTKGLIKGISDVEFGIGINISRQDMVVLTHRYMTYAGVNFEEGEILTFSDKAQIGDYALDAVYALSHNGVVKGMEDGTFRPMANSNRAEAAQIIYNALKYSGRYQ